MAIVSAFTFILGDSNRYIRDGANLWSQEFYSGNCFRGGPAMLMLMVKGLTWAKNNSALVKINGYEVGRIYPYRWPTSDAVGAHAANWWHTQIIQVNGQILKPAGPNKIEIFAVGFPEATRNNEFDDFAVRDVVCFYHKTT